MVITRAAAATTGQALAPGLAPTTRPSRAGHGGTTTTTTTNKVKKTKSKKKTAAAGRRAATAALEEELLTLRNTITTLTAELAALQQEKAEVAAGYALLQQLAVADAPHGQSHVKRDDMTVAVREIVRQNANPVMMAGTMASLQLIAGERRAARVDTRLAEVAIEVFPESSDVRVGERAWGGTF